MLNILRKKGFAKKVLWVVAIVIIISFGFFGTAYLLRGNQAPGYAGEIFGKKIGIDEFSRAYQKTTIQARFQYGYDLERYAHLLNLEAQTWDRLILLHEAMRRRIRIADEDVIALIRRNPSFVRDGRFDILVYNGILRNLRVRPRDYEESIRDQLKIAEIYNRETASITLSVPEVLDEYKKRNEQVQISYVFVSPDNFKDEVSVNADQVKQYYEEHKSDFLMPPSINVQYLTFAFPEEPETATGPASEEGAEEDLPEAVDTSNTEAPSIDEQKNLLRNKAYETFQELLADPDLAKAAAANGLTVQSTGFFSMEQPNLSAGWSYNVLNELFQMTEGEISEPVETDKGVSIVQIKKKRDAYIPTFQEAQDKARESLITQEARKIAQKKAAEYLTALQEEMDKTKLRDFPKAAKTLQLEIHQTPAFNRGQYLPQIGISKEFQEAAFGLTGEDPVSNVVETEPGYCILHLDEVIPIKMEDFELAKDGLAEEMLQDKRNAAFSDYVAQLRVKADLFNNLARLRAEEAAKLAAQ